MKNTTILKICDFINEEIENSEQYNNLLAKITKLLYEIEGLLPTEKQQLVYNIDSLYNDAEAETANLFFTAGFKLGLKLCAETFLE